MLLLLFRSVYSLVTKMSIQHVLLIKGRILHLTKFCYRGIISLAAVAVFDLVGSL